MLSGFPAASFAQETAHSSSWITSGIKNATAVPFKADADISEYLIPQEPIKWGMDVAWDYEDNVRRGTNYIGKDVMATGRISFQPSDLVNEKGELSAAQQAALQTRLDHISLSGVRNVILNCDHEKLNKANYYGKPEEWYKVIKASVLYAKSKGFNVITISPFNEPDYDGWGEGTMDHFKAIAKLITEDPDQESVFLQVIPSTATRLLSGITIWHLMPPKVTLISLQVLSRTMLISGKR